MSCYYCCCCWQMKKLWRLLAYPLLLSLSRFFGEMIDSRGLTQQRRNCAEEAGGISLESCDDESATRTGKIVRALRQLFVLFYLFFLFSTFVFAFKSDLILIIHSSTTKYPLTIKLFSDFFFERVINFHFMLMLFIF